MIPLRQDPEKSHSRGHTCTMPVWVGGGQRGKEGQLFSTDRVPVLHDDCTAIIDATELSTEE